MHNFYVDAVVIVMDIIRSVDAHLIAFGQAFSDRLSATGYQICHLLRDASAFTMAVPVVLTMVQLLSPDTRAEALVCLVFTAIISLRLSPLIMIHHAMSRLGWTHEVKDIYRKSAHLTRQDSFPVRMMSLTAVVIYGVYTLFFDRDVKLSDFLGYLCIFSYTALSYFECAEPPLDKPEIRRKNHIGGRGWRVAFN